MGRGAARLYQLMAMLKYTFLLLLTVITAYAEPLVTPFNQPENFPLTFRLVLPKEAAVISHKQKNNFDTITARMSDDRRGGMVVEAVDAIGKQVWKRDFGHNLSAVPGCSVSISFHPQIKALIVSYEGYKWDHQHTLLFVDKMASTYTIREYSEAAPEIDSFLKKQPGYQADSKYWIHPTKFSGHEIVFSCIPLTPLQSTLPHPLDQEHPWYDITASMDKDFKITPVAAEVSKE